MSDTDSEHDSETVSLDFVAYWLTIFATDDIYSEEDMCSFIKEYNITSRSFCNTPELAERILKDSVLAPSDNPVTGIKFSHILHLTKHAVSHMVLTDIARISTRLGNNAIYRQIKNSL